MLGSMSLELQRTLENYKAYDMIQELKTMFEKQDKQELFETVKAFHACKQEDGQSVSSYLLKMKSYLEILEHLGYAMLKELGTLAELHAMLKLHEKGIPKKAETPVMLAIREGKIQTDKKKPQRARERISLLMLPMLRSHRHLREIIWKSEIHLTAVKTILKYLRNTKDMVLVYGAKPEDELKVSSVDWKSAKKSTTAMSSTEAEYIAFAEASVEAV
ncbi:hypothetical protein Tco_0815849 [Tanacetum coccineum]